MSLSSTQIMNSLQMGQYHLPFYRFQSLKLGKRFGKSKTLIAFLIKFQNNCYFDRLVSTLFRKVYL